LDHAPHVVVNVVHLNGVGDLFLVEFCPSREDVDVLVVEDARSSGVTGHVQVGDATPGVVLDIVLFTSGVEGLSVVSSNDEH